MWLILKRYIFPVDTRTKVESGGRPEELKLNSSAHERSGANPASVSQLVDDNGGNITACDPLVEMQAARSKDSSDPK